MARRHSAPARPCAELVNDLDVLRVLGIVGGERRVQDALGLIVIEVQPDVYVVPPGPHCDLIVLPWPNWWRPEPGRPRAGPPPGRAPRPACWPLPGQSVISCQDGRQTRCGAMVPPGVTRRSRPQPGHAIQWSVACGFSAANFIVCPFCRG